jgi:hypothetical protein
MIVAQISTQDPEGPGIPLIGIEANASDHGGALVALNAPRKNQSGNNFFYVCSEA